MLGIFRGFLNTWPAKVFFLVLALAFALWGVSGKNPFGADTDAAATVGGHRIDLAELQQAYKRQAAQLARMLGKPELPPEMRRMAATAAVDTTVTQQALQNKVAELGLAAPDAAVREAAFAVPAFHGTDGAFDRTRMTEILRANGMTEPMFLNLLRRDLTTRQLLGAIHAVAQPPKALVDRIYSYQHETRTAEMVELPFAEVTTPPVPTDAQLQRWWQNHPESFSAPEYRRIKAVVLTPEAVGKDIAVGDEELRAAYEQHKAEYNQPERRSVQVLTAPDDATATRLATQWSLGTSWGAMQQAAQTANATAVELPDASRAELPSSELADAAFATGADTVAPPAHGALGWYVVKVTKITPGGAKSFEAARDAVRARVVASKASDRIDTSAGKIDDLLAGGTAVADLPADLGLVPIEGTLDAQGNAASGQPAPIPGSPALRAMLVQAAFDAKVGDTPKLVQTPASPDAPPSMFALSVESVTPPAPKPYASVADAVRASWVRDAVRHQQDVAATAILTAAQAGKNLADAAGGRQVKALPATGRDEPAAGVPAALLGPLFGIAKGQATMVETPAGFVVAALTGVNSPDPGQNGPAVARLRGQMAQSTSTDAEAVFAAAVRDGERPHVQPGVLESLAQAGDGTSGGGTPGGPAP